MQPPPIVAPAPVVSPPPVWQPAPVWQSPPVWAQPPVAPPRPPVPQDPPADVTLNKRQVSVKFWDDNVEDGDRIRVRVNGQVVPGLEDLRLRNKGDSFTLTLQPGANTISIEALDTGTQGPCTAAFQLEADAVVSGQARRHSADMKVGETSELQVEVKA